ncbi:MAG TPA: universal stress protein, partial [Ktedonobacteraceae bacterium]|nr:universal stress protein [Ktedonobacteraceae bacterium]
MFKRIIIPLDGSSRAEHAIPVAARIARAAGASIVLVRAVTIPMKHRRPLAVPPEVARETIDAELNEVKRYLEGIARSGTLAGILVETTASVGPDASTLLSAAESLHADLIVMCSHGYTGFKRWVLGSVAQKIARHSPVPVLVLHAEGSVPTNIHAGGIRPVRVLVALDGSSLAETTLVPAAHLSKALSAPAQGMLHLARVIPWPPIEGTRQNERATAARAWAESDAKAYLERVEQRLREGELAALGLSISTSVVVHEDVADTLMRMAERGEYMDDIEG